MLAKIIVERGLIDDVLASDTCAVRCEIEMESGDTFEHTLYTSRYEYNVQAYLGPVTPVQQEVLERLLATGVKSVLDVGSGSGYLAAWLQDRGLDVTACEIDIDAAKICQARGLQRVISMSVLEMEGPFDAVMLLGGSVPVTPTRDLTGAVRNFMRHLHRLLRPGGVILTDLAHYQLPVLSMNHEFKVAKIRFGAEGTWTDFSHHIYPSPEVMKRIMTKLGFILEYQRHVDIGSTHNSTQEKYFSFWRRT